MHEDERVSDPADEKHLRDYLHRKSALSMGYRKAYVEAPPPELDQAVKARARRALRWLGPAAIAGLITFIMIASLILGVGKWMQAMVAAERNIKAIQKQQEEERLKEELSKPVTVVIDEQSLAPADQSTQSNDKNKR
jgi:hypothetical protein